MKRLTQLTKEENTVLIQRIRKFLSEDQELERGDLSHIVQKFIKRKNQFLTLATKYRTPFYVLDRQELQTSIHSFDIAFKKYIPNHKVYFAMKTNYHPYLLQTIVNHGWGLDVSSRREFDLATESGCTDMLFTGPGKTVEDLSYVLQKNPQVIINMDSFGELKRLGEVSNILQRKIKAGIRIYTTAHKTWKKFGISLQDLAQFWKEAKNYPFIDLQGIQFHLSWNETALPYKQAIEEVATYLKQHFSQEDLSTIQFIDFGGGYRPYKSEGKWPWVTPQGEVIKVVNDYYDIQTEFHDKYFISPSIPIADFASEIGEAISTYFGPLVSCTYYTEPGRIISNNSMHILLRVVDKKSEETVIMDGGINIVGWERFEYDYFPVINLSKPSLTETKCTIFGSLCDPADFWSHYYYGNDIADGDVCIVPYQGCLTYSLAQNFIHAIPPVYVLE